MVAAFSLPLLGVATSGDSRPRDWIVAVSISAAACLGAFLFLRVAVRGLCSWRVTVEKRGDGFWLKRSALGFRWGKRVSINSALLVSPAYQRGDWGYSVWLRPKRGRKALVVKPTLISPSISEAKSAGKAHGDLLASHLGVSVEIDESWVRHEDVAARRHHADESFTAERQKQIPISNCASNRAPTASTLLWKAAPPGRGGREWPAP